MVKKVKKFDMPQAQLWTILNAQQNKKQQTNSPSKEIKKFDMSEAQLWAILNAQQNKKQQISSPSDKKGDSYIKFFNKHSREHLKKEYDPNGNANQPSKIIKDAQSSIGALSRIFDEYDCPTPNYEEINAIYQKPNGLREHIQENLKGIIPVLLNEDRTALHPDVIEAIGQENYNAILNNAQGDERAIAEQFVKAVISGYGQRIYQNTDDGYDLHLMSELPESTEQYKNSYLFIKKGDTRELYYIKPDGKYEKVEINDFNLFEETINAIKNKDETKLHLSEKQIKEIVTSNGSHTPENLKFNLFNTVMPALGELANEVTLKGLPEQSKETNLADIQKMSEDLLKLLDEANTAGIEIPNEDKMRNYLDCALEAINIQSKPKAIKDYDQAINYFITGVKETLATKPPKPEEVHWFKKFLRFITGNEKLLQNADEKRYDQQIKVLSGISDLNKKLNSLSQEKNISSEHEHTHDHGHGNQMTFSN